MGGSNKRFSWGLSLHLTLKQQTKAIKCITCEMKIKYLVYGMWTVVLQVLFWTLSISWKKKTGVALLRYNNELDSLADGWETHSESQVNAKFARNQLVCMSFFLCFRLVLCCCLKALHHIKQCLNFHGLFAGTDCYLQLVPTQEQNICSAVGLNWIVPIYWCSRVNLGCSRVNTQFK